MATLPKRVNGRAKARPAATGGAESVEQVRRSGVGGSIPTGNAFNVSSGSAEIGETFKSLGRRLLAKEVDEKNLQDQNEFNLANLEFKSLQTQLEDGFNEDPEFHTMGERAADTMDTRALELSKGITDEVNRQKFLASAQRSGITTLIQAKVKRRTKEKDLALQVGTTFENSLLEFQVSNPQASADELDAGRVGVEGYYRSLAEAGTIGRVELQTHLKNFKTKSGKVQFSQDLRYFNERGGPIDFEVIKKNLREGSYGFSSNEAELKIDEVTKDFLVKSTTQQKKSDEELKVKQEQNYLGLAERFPGNNFAVDAEGNPVPDLTNADIRLAVANRQLLKTDADKLRKGLQVATEAQTELLTDDFQEQLNSAEIQVASKTANSITQINKIQTALMLARQNGTEVPDEEQSRYTKVLGDIAAWKKDIGDDKKKEQLSQIKEVNRVIRASIGLKETLGDKIAAFTPSLTAPQREDEQTILELQGIAEARIRSGEHFLKVQNDIRKRIKEDAGGVASISFDPELIAQAKADARDFSLPGIDRDLAIRRLQLNRRQLDRAADQKDTASVAPDFKPSKK